MSENSRGFHHPRQVNFERGGTGQGRMEPPAQGRAGMKEPTNHSGHTYEHARRGESDARINSIRKAHAGVGQRDHEKILHETHRLGQGRTHEPGSDGEQTKHGEAHHWRED